MSACRLLANMIADGYLCHVSDREMSCCLSMTCRLCTGHTKLCWVSFSAKASEKSSWFVLLLIHNIFTSLLVSLSNSHADIPQSIFWGRRAGKHRSHGCNLSTRARGHVPPSNFINLQSLFHSFILGSELIYFANPFHHRLFLAYRFDFADFRAI